LEDKNQSGALNFFAFAEKFLKSVDSSGTLRWHNTSVANLNYLSVINYHSLNLICQIYIGTVCQREKTAAPVTTEIKKQIFIQTQTFL
jgi:hypothetical protein